MATYRSRQERVTSLPPQTGFQGIASFAYLLAAGAGRGEGGGGGEEAAKLSTNVGIRKTSMILTLS